MQNILITEENLEEYKDYLGADMAENVGREFIRALALRDEKSGEIHSALMWEIENKELESRDTQSKIYMLKYTDRIFGKKILDAYTELVRQEKALRSIIELKSSETETAVCLMECGFDLREASSEDITVPLKNILKIPLLQKDTPDTMIPVKELSHKQFEEGIRSSIANGRRSLIEDILYIPKRWFEQELSCCILSGKEVSDMLLIHKSPSGMLIPQLIFGSGPNASVNMLNLICHSLKTASEKYPPETPVKLRLDPRILSWVKEKLLIEITGDYIFFGERKEKIQPES